MNLTLDRRAFLRGAGVAALAALGPRARGDDAPRRRLRVAQIGTTHPHGPGKWDTAKKLTDAIECVGVWEPDAEAKAEAKKTATFGDANWLEEDQLFALGDLDAVLVETELPDLLKMGRRVLEKGVNLHMDKPPGADLAEFTALQEMAAQKHLVFQPGYMFRYHPTVLFAFDVMRQGVLGKVFAVHADIGKQMPASRRPWLGKVYTGAMMALGSHLLDLTVAALGPPSHVAAFRRKTYPGKDDLYDNEVAILEYPEALGTVRSMLTEVDGEDRRQFVIYGDNGTVEILPLEQKLDQPGKVRLALRRPAGRFKAGSHLVTVAPVVDRYEGMVRDFVGRIQGAPPRLPGYTAAHDRLVQSIALKFHGASPGA